MTFKLKVLSAAAVTSLLFTGCAKEETKTSEAQDKKTEQTVKKKKQNNKKWILYKLTKMG